MHRSTDGQNWQQIGAVLEDKRALSIASVGNELFVGVENRGVWIMPAPIAADLNGDGAVNVFDLFMLLEAWGACDQPCLPACSGDINADCAVDVFDLFEMLSAWTD